MKELSTNMSKQYDLLRLIVQKMEIHTEDENQDEGVTNDSFNMSSAKSKWTPVVKKNIVRQSAVLAAWKNSMDQDI